MINPEGVSISRASGGDSGHLQGTANVPADSGMQCPRIWHWLPLASRHCPTKLEHCHRHMSFDRQLCQCRPDIKVSGNSYHARCSTKRKQVDKKRLGVSGLFQDLEIFVRQSTFLALTQKLG